MKLLLILFVSLVFAFPTKIAAYQPIMENRLSPVTSSSPYDLFASAMLLGDATFASYGVFGALIGEAIDMYVFGARVEDTIPIELQVPAKEKFAAFRPILTIIGPYVAGGVKSTSPVAVPVGFESVSIPMPAARSTAYDSWGLQSVWRGEIQSVHVFPGASYYLVVTNADATGGSYILRVGAKENWKGSVKDTTTKVDANALVFENVPRRDASAPSQTERAQFAEQKTPFETLDSRLRLWLDTFFFYINRIPALLRS